MRRLASALAAALSLLSVQGKAGGIGGMAPFAAPAGMFVVAGPTYMPGVSNAVAEVGGGSGDNNYTEAHAFFHQQMGNCSPTAMRFVYVNGGWGTGNDFTTTGPGNAVTFEADYEYPAGTPHRITFGGLNAISVASGAFTVSDPITANIPPALAHFYTMTRVQVASGSTWFRAWLPIWTNGTTSEGVTEDPGNFDQVMTAGPPAAQSGGTTPVSGPTAAPGLGPIAIIGNVSDCHSTMIWGDSWMIGSYDATGGSGSPLYAVGIAARGLRDGSNNIVPYIRVARSGSSARDWGTGLGLDAQLLPLVRNLIAGTWGNDINGARLPTFGPGHIEQEITAIANAAAANNVRFFPTVFAIQTSSTDQFETYANQTASEKVGGVADLVNQWLLGGGAGPASYVVDFSLGNPAGDGVGLADPANRYLFVVNGSADYATGPSGTSPSGGAGTHPNGQGYALGASEISTNHVSQLQ